MSNYVIQHDARRRTFTVKDRRDGSLIALCRTLDTATVAYPFAEVVR